MAHKQPGYRFENDWGMDVLEDDAKSIAAGVALPIFQEIKQNNTVLNLDNVKKYLERSKKIAVTNCACRTKRHHCNAPVDVCLMLNAAADNFLEKGFVQTAGGMRQPIREVNIDEAIEIVTRAHDAGLVQMAYIRMDSPEPHDPSFVCSCCSCCCAELGLTLRFGMAPHLLKSIAISMNDSSKCKSCGKCVDRCHFGARKMVDGKMVYNKDLCFGCGLCVSTCPEKAVSLTQFG
jgi:ferredoxin